MAAAKTVDPHQAQLGMLIEKLQEVHRNWPDLKPCRNKMIPPSRVVCMYEPFLNNSYRTMTRRLRQTHFQVSADL